MSSTTSTIEMSHEEWLTERRSGIGGSDIGAVLGLNPYKTPLDVFLDKTGKVEPEDLSDNPRVHFGNVLEDIVAQEYARKTGWKVRKRNQIFRHPDHKWMLANIDRSVNGQKKILECKTADAWTKGNWGAEFTDEVPDHYLVQPAWYMPILNYQSADLAVLIGGNDHRIYNFDRDSELEETIIERAHDFWFKNVLADIPPEPINNHDLEIMYAMDNGKFIVATAQIESTVEKLKGTRAQIKKLEEEKGKFEFEIKKFMGEHSEVLLDGENQKLITWKRTKDSKKFNEKKFKLEHPDLHSSFNEVKPGHRRLLVK